MVYLSQVTFLGAAGLGSLVDARAAATRHNIKLHLLLMHELADDVHITVAKDHPGTTVRLRWHLDKPTDAHR